MGSVFNENHRIRLRGMLFGYDERRLPKEKAEIEIGGQIFRVTLQRGEGRRRWLDSLARLKLSRDNGNDFYTNPVKFIGEKENHFQYYVKTLQKLAAEKIIDISACVKEDRLESLRYLTEKKMKAPNATKKVAEIYDTLESAGIKCKNNSSGFQNLMEYYRGTITESQLEGVPNRSHEPGKLLSYTQPETTLRYACEILKIDAQTKDDTLFTYIDMSLEVPTSEVKDAEELQKAIITIMKLHNKYAEK